MKSNNKSSNLSNNKTNPKLKKIKRKNVLKNKNKKVKVDSCPVGKVCLKSHHIIIVIGILILGFIVYLWIHRNNNDKESSLSNVKTVNQMNKTGGNNNRFNKIFNLNRKFDYAEELPHMSNNTLGNASIDNLIHNLKNNKKQANQNSQSNLDSDASNTHITINYMGNSENTPDTGSYIINKDYERIINPLEPPERRNFHLNASGLVRVPGVPINVPTRGYSGGMVQVGVLHKEETHDESKEIGQNKEPVILPLFGSPTYNGSHKWTYYTATDKYNQVKLPISNKSRVCNKEYGCDELFDGESVTVPAYNGNFKVSIYEFDKPQYIPYV